jgi:hypothetical protein
LFSGGAVDIGQRVGVAKAVALVVLFLNDGKDFEVLMGYLDLFYSDVLDGSGYKIDRDDIRGFLYSCLDKGYGVEPSVGYYEFVKEGMSAGERIAVINMTRGLATAQRNYEIVSLVVMDLISDEGTSLFITNRLISERSGDYNVTDDGEIVCLSVDAVRRALTEELCEKIDKHNSSKCFTSNFKVYEKFCNVNRIKQAIRTIAHIREKMTKDNIASHAYVSRRTVYNLWWEEDVQEFLNKYNKVFEAA